jgi:hypothetical protein
MNKEQNMNFYTNDIWDNLEISGKAFAYMRHTMMSRMDDYIDQLHSEAKDYGVQLSIKLTESTGRLYVYLRKIRA